jgi:hypothetical protein
MISDERMEAVISSIGNIGTARLSPEERASLVDTVVSKNNRQWALTMLMALENLSRWDMPLTPEEISKLKAMILEANDVEIACSALLNFPKIFTKDELAAVRKLAYTTKDPYWAYHIYRNDCFALNKEKEARNNLRSVVVWTQDPGRAFGFLQAQDDNADPYNDDLKSLEFSDEDLKRFKQVIISSRKPEWSYRLLMTKQFKEWADEEEDSYMYDDPHAIIELTPNERVTLKRSIIDSQDPAWAYETLAHVDDLTQGEHMVFKGILMRTKDPVIACAALCNTDFFPHLNQNERDYLRKLAAQIQSSYSARDALKYIYDLTPEERANLEKIAAT